MEEKKMNGVGGPEEPKVDPKKLEAVKEIFQLIANTLSLMKIYRTEHSSVRKFLDELHEKMTKFLDDLEVMEIGVEGYSFTYQGETVHRDENPAKSLPFLLHKDGVQILFFYKGMERQEIQDFLEILKKEAQLPPEASDIVARLWERDFSFIRFFAPDDYLETKIAAKKEAIEWESKSPEGKIELTQEDKTGVGVWGEKRGKKGVPGKEKKGKEKISPGEGVSVSGGEEDKEKIAQVADFVSKISSLDEKELSELESLIDANRKILPEEEFPSLIIEMLYLEDRLEKFQETLNILEQNQLETIERAGLAHASLVINHIQELKEVLSSQSAEKAKLLEKFLLSTRDEKSLAVLKNLVSNEQISDFIPFFQYIELLGPRTMPLIADLIEETKRPDFRRMAMGYLRELSQNDIKALLNLATESRPYFTREVISQLHEGEIKNTLSFFTNFVSSKNKSLKLEAIHALGKVEDDKANKILLGFLADQDEDIRIQAASRLKFLADKALLEQLMQFASTKEFPKKSLAEKSAILNSLGRTRADEACRFLQKILKKSSFFPNPKQIETRICAVGALEVMATPQAVEALREGAKLRNKKIKQACQSALGKMGGGKSD